MSSSAASPSSFGICGRTSSIISPSDGVGAVAITFMAKPIMSSAVKSAAII